MRRIQNLMEQWLFIGPDKKQVHGMQKMVRMEETITTEEPAITRKHLKNRSLIQRQRKFIWNF